jgi:hypothetical protein
MTVTPTENTDTNMDEAQKNRKTVERSYAQHNTIRISELLVLRSKVELPTGLMPLSSLCTQIGVDLTNLQLLQPLVALEGKCYSKATIISNTVATTLADTSLITDADVTAAHLTSHLSTLDLSRS